jgi:transposase
VNNKKGENQYTLKDRSKQMREQRYRKYPEEFKMEALRLLATSEKSAAELERELGITEGMLLKWRERYQIRSSAEGQTSLEPSDLAAAKREIKRLERELREVAEEREILKKAMRIFSRNGG